MKISNSTPRIDFRGIKDESTRSVPVQEPRYPMHMPLFFTPASRGTEDAYPGVGTILSNMYGIELTDKASKYATHVTPYIELCQENGNYMLIKRVIPDDAPAPARVRLCLEVETDANINEYARDEFGNVQYDILQQPIVTGTRKGTKLRWLTLQDAMRGSLVEEAASISGQSLRNASGIISAMASTSETQIANLASSKEIALGVITNTEEMSETIRESYKTKVNDAKTIAEVKTVLTDFTTDLMYRVTLITNLNTVSFIPGNQTNVNMMISLIRTSDADTVKNVIPPQVEHFFEIAAGAYEEYYAEFVNSTQKFARLAASFTAAVRSARAISPLDNLADDETFKKYTTDGDPLGVVPLAHKLYKYGVAADIPVQAPAVAENATAPIDVMNALEEIAEYQGTNNSEFKEYVNTRYAALETAIAGDNHTADDVAEFDFLEKVKNTITETADLMSKFDTQSSIQEDRVNDAVTAAHTTLVANATTMANEVPTNLVLGSNFANGFRAIANSTDLLQLMAIGVYDITKDPVEYAYQTLATASGDIFKPSHWKEGFDPNDRTVPVKDYIIAAGETYYIPTSSATPLVGLNVRDTSSTVVSTLPDGTLKDHCVAAFSTSSIINPDDAESVIGGAFTYADGLSSESIQAADIDTIKAIIKAAVNSTTVYRGKINTVIVYNDETTTEDPDNPGGTVVVKPTRPVTEEEINRVLMSDIASLKPFVGKNPKSKIYPILDLAVTWRGEYGNNCGIGIHATNQDEELIQELGSFTYGFTVWNRESKFATPVRVRSIYSTETFKFTFNPAARDPISKAVYDLQQIMLNQYRDLNTAGTGEPTYGDFNDLHVYADNVEKIQKLLFEAEAAEDATIAEFANKFEHPEYIINFVDGRDYNRNPYRTFAVTSITNDADGLAIDWSDTTRIFAAGGGDGTLTEAVFDDLVRRELDHFGELGVMFEDMAQYPFGQFYDTGFSANTKKSIFKILSKRPDVNVTLSVFDGKVRRDMNEILSIATMLNSVGKNYVESETYGTPLTRAVLVAQTGYLINDTSYTKPVSVAYELMHMRSSYMGDPDGRLRSGFEYDEAPGNRAALLKDITNQSMFSTTRAMMWSKNVTYFQCAARGQLFCPAVQTMYSNETSVLRSDINMQICCDLNKVAFKVWTELTGRNISNAKLCDLSNRRISDITSMKYGGRVIITPDTFITAIDKARGWSWTTHIHGEFSNMKTVNDLTIISHRLTEDE